MSDLQLLPNKPTLAQIQQLEAVCRPMEQVPIEAVHYFSDGLYGREITIPAGVVIVGRLHRHNHLIMLMVGDVTIYTDDGMVRMQGPKTWQSKAGTKRAIYAHAESVIITVHANPDDETNITALEDRFIEPETELLSSQGSLT